MFVFIMQNLQIVNYTTCFHEISEIFDFVTNGYILVLFIFLFILSLLTASVPSSTFRREGVATYKAVAFVLLPTPFVFLTRVTVLLSHEPERFEALLWVEFSWTIILPLILLAVLFAPTVSRSIHKIIVHSKLYSIACILLCMSPGSIFTIHTLISGSALYMICLFNES